MRPDRRKTYKYYGSAVVRFVDNYDGDTFRFDCDEWPVIVGRSMPCRLANINTPERFSTDMNTSAHAEACKKRLYEILSSAKVITLVGIQRGKYFRIVANVSADGVDVGELMISENFGTKIQEAE